MIKMEEEENEILDSRTLLQTSQSTETLLCLAGCGACVCGFCLLEAKNVDMSERGRVRCSLSLSLSPPGPSSTVGDIERSLRTLFWPFNDLLFMAIELVVIVLRAGQRMEWMDTSQCNLGEHRARSKLNSMEGLGPKKKKYDVSLFMKGSGGIDRDTKPPDWIGIKPNRRRSIDHRILTFFLTQSDHQRGNDDDHDDDGDDQGKVAVHQGAST